MRKSPKTPKLFLKVLNAKALSSIWTLKWTLELFCFCTGFPKEFIIPLLEMSCFVIHLRFTLLNGFDLSRMCCHHVLWGVDASLDSSLAWLHSSAPLLDTGMDGHLSQLPRASSEMLHAIERFRHTVEELFGGPKCRCGLLNSTSTVFTASRV